MGRIKSEKHFFSFKMSKNGDAILSTLLFHVKYKLVVILGMFSTSIDQLRIVTKMKILNVVKKEGRTSSLPARWWEQWFSSLEHYLRSRRRLKGFITLQEDQDTWTGRN